MIELIQTRKVVKKAKVVKKTKASKDNLSNRGKRTTLEDKAKMVTWLENEDNFNQIVGKIGQTAKMGSSKPLTKELAYKVLAEHMGDNWTADGIKVNRN